MDWLIDQKITCLFLVIALRYICYAASHHYSLHSMRSQCDTYECINESMGQNETDESMGQRQTCKKAIDHTDQVSAHESTSALNYGQFREWARIYDLIGSNVFMEEWTGDNTICWAIIPTAGFISCFVSHTESLFLHYYPSGLLQIEEKMEHILPEKFVLQLWIPVLALLVADAVFRSCFCS